MPSIGLIDLKPVREFSYLSTAQIVGKRSMFLAGMVVWAGVGIRAGHSMMPGTRTQPSFPDRSWITSSLRLDAPGGRGNRWAPCDWVPPPWESTWQAGPESSRSLDPGRDL